MGRRATFESAAPYTKFNFPDFIRRGEDQGREKASGNVAFGRRTSCRSARSAVPWRTSLSTTNFSRWRYLTKNIREDWQCGKAFSKPETEDGGSKDHARGQTYSEVMKPALGIEFSRFDKYKHEQAKLKHMSLNEKRRRQVEMAAEKKEGEAMFAEDAFALKIRKF